MSLVALAVVALVFFTIIIVGLATNPSNDREWNPDQELLSYAEVNDNLVTVYNIRNFSYTSTDEYEKDYYDKTFDLEKLKKVWYVVEPFEGVPGSAHTFLSFEFEDDEFISVSVEIRKERGESFHPVKGLFNQYEIMYVVADERDVIKLRSNYRKDDVYVYPARTSKEKMQALFLDVFNRVNDLKDNPEFYNTIVNNCTTNIARHINSITPNTVPLLSLRLIFPASSDKLAHQLGLLDTELSLEDARAKYHINKRAEAYADAEDFSVRIRENE